MQETMTEQLKAAPEKLFTMTPYQSMLDRMSTVIKSNTEVSVGAM
jgi:hypothetical protein